MAGREQKTDSYSSQPRRQPKSPPTRAAAQIKTFREKYAGLERARHRKKKQQSATSSKVSSPDPSKLKGVKLQKERIPQLGEYPTVDLGGGLSTKIVTLNRKPFKICGVKERKKIGVVASTLKELRSKMQTSIDTIGNDFKVVLEKDCTRVEDEDYFQLLPDNTVLMAVSKGEHWTGASSSLEAEFSKGYVERDGKMSSEETSQRLARVATRIVEFPAVLALLHKLDLEVIANADLNELQVLLHQTKDTAECIQDACERRLVDIIRSDEAKELLKLYHRAKTETKEDTPKKDTRSSRKRARTKAP